MSVEDRLIAMHARHACARTALDIAELTINCNKGVIDLTGKVKRPRNLPHGQPFDVKKEFKHLTESIRATKGVKDVYAERIEFLD